MTGSCLCGGVRYAIDAPLQLARNCHCSACRKATGAAFATNGYVPIATFKWIRGEELIAAYASSPDVTRTFCRVCGSTLQFIARQYPDAFGIALGSVDGDPGCRPARHVYVGSKASWFEITDDLPQSDTSPDGD